MTKTSTKNLMLILGIILIAANMRVGLTSVGPVVDLIQQDLNLSSSFAGLLTTLPILAFALISPIAPKYANRFGTEKILFVGILLLIVGLCFRSLLALLGIFLGTVIIGAAIAIFNVLLPSLLKQKFTTRVGIMTGLYTTVMSIWGSVGSGISHPVAVDIGWGWRGALGCWILLAILAAISWLPQLRSQRSDIETNQSVAIKAKLWKSKLAWYITFFMGFQSVGFFITITWLPTILHDKGMSVTTAGWMLSILLLISIPATFIAPIIAERLHNQQRFTAIISWITLLGYVCLLFDDLLVIYLAILFLGIGQGAAISLVLSFIATRAANTAQSIQLSGMVQSIGYLIAAFAPSLFGLIHDFSHTWTYAILALIFITTLMTYFGYLAGKNEYVLSPEPIKES